MNQSDLEIEIKVSLSSATFEAISFETHFNTIRTGSFVIGVCVGGIAAVTTTLIKLDSTNQSVWVGINTGLTVFIGCVAPTVHRYFQLERFLSESDKWSVIREDYSELLDRVRLGMDIDRAKAEFLAIRKREAQAAKAGGTLPQFGFLKKRIRAAWKKRVNFKEPSDAPSAG